MIPAVQSALLEKFLAAIAREQELRELAGSPGSPNHDPRLWQEYLAAVEATTQASREYRASLDAPAGDP